MDKDKKVIIKWIDSRQIHGWMLDGEIDDTCCSIESCGFLVRETEDAYTVALSKGYNPLQWCGINVIPKCCVVSIIFPELKGNDDEKVRKTLIKFFEDWHKTKSHCWSVSIPKILTWLEKQGEQDNNEDSNILQRFSFYSYKDESNILYLSGLYVNGECRNKGIGTKILEVADEVAKNLNCYAIRLKTEIGSNAERLYRRNGYNTFKREGNNVWLQKQGEHKKFRDSIQVGDEVTRNSDGVIVNLSQLKRVAKKSEQKLPIEKLPSEMKTIRESLGFTTQEECDEYNEMVTNLIMGDDDKGEQKTALSEEELTDFEKSLKHVMEETLECGDIHNLKADADLLLRLVKPTDDDMKEALRTEYEKGRADAFAQMQKEWSEEDEKMVANLVDYFKVDDALQYTEKQVVDWLKSLKGRAQPQPKQEWSEEDQNALEDVREAVVHYWGGDTQDILLYWLKSIKQKIKGE